jgi:hypothetical protein
MIDDRDPQAMFSEFVSAQFYLVIIEWGGKRPPTRYYKRIRGVTKKLHGYQSSDANLWGKPRDMQALTLQEGVIMCPDKRTALTIASWARDGGAVFVEIMRASHYDIRTVTEDDVHKVEEFTNQLTKRGKPPPPSDWSVTCIHEGASRYARDSRVLTCPKCGSVMVRVENGVPDLFKLPKTYETDASVVLKYWTRTRFIRGKYFIPIEIPSDVESASLTAIPAKFRTLPRKVHDIKNQRDKEYFELMFEPGNDTRIIDALTGMSATFNIYEKISFLDGLFIAGRFYPDEKAHARIHAIVIASKKGAKVAPGTSLIPSDRIDIYDVWPHWDADSLAALALQMYGREED